MELEFGFIIVVFALVLWLVFRQKRQQTEQHQNSVSGNSLMKPFPRSTSHVSYTGHVVNFVDKNEQWADTPLAQAAYLSALLVSR